MTPGALLIALVCMPTQADFELDSPADGLRVVVARTFSVDRPVVRILDTEGTQRAAVVGSRLHAAPADPEAWLAQEPSLALLASPLGERRQLVLSLAGGGERYVELDGGRVWFSAPPALQHAPIVAAHREEEAQAVYVEDVQAPERGLEGSTLEVLIEGSMPNPGWSFAGFRLAGERASDGGLELVVTALGLPPNDGMLRPQVLAPFAQTLRLSGLEAGRYRLRVVGRAQELAAQNLEVLAADPILTLRRSGGFAGVNESVALYSDGWVEWTDRLGGPRAGAAALEPSAFERARALLAELPASSRLDQDTSIVDGFEHSLSFPRAGEVWQRSVFGTPEGSPERQLTELLSSF